MLCADDGLEAAPARPRLRPFVRSWIETGDTPLPFTACLSMTGAYLLILMSLCHLFHGLKLVMESLAWACVVAC